jgi:outer membrane protein TolC
MTRFWLLLGIGLSMGCHHCVSSPYASSSFPAQLPVGSRGKVQPDITALSTEPSNGTSPRPQQYRYLSAAECRFLAITHTPFADDLDSHPDNQTNRRCTLPRREQQANLSRLVRGYAADELRNRAAAEALELYYKLAAAEGQFDLLLAGHAVLKVQLAATEKALDVGAADRAGADRLKRQLLELESQLAELEAAIAVLNAGLTGHLGLDPSIPTPIWPSDQLCILNDQPDVELAVRTSLRNRPDLNLLRSLASNAEQGGELANAVLNSINPLLGSTDSSNPFLGPLMSILLAAKKEPSRAEALAHRQVLSSLATRERLAESEVRAAAAMLRGNRAAAAAKSSEVRNLTARVAETEKRAAAGVAGAEAELALARLDLLKARADLIRSVADWHIKDVKLRQATGMLVRE